LIKIEADVKCPICKRKAECIEFKIRAGDFARIYFRCAFCKIIFVTETSKFKIGNKSISFYEATGVSEIYWRKEGKFNPSSR